MSWFKTILPSRIMTSGTSKKGVPEGLWSKCEACASVLYKAELERNLQVCPKCDHHHYISARSRLLKFLDSEDVTELATQVLPQDRLRFKDSKKYRDRLNAAQKATGETEAMVVMQGLLHGMPVVCAASEYHFIGGSMGAAVGERFVQAVNACFDQGIPLISFAASGGARMQEGMFSLLQMAKTSAALQRFTQSGLPYISVLTDPTMGGVSASFAMLGDIIIAEPKARIGFAGPRVIEQTVGEKLPEGFQRSEFLLDHGALDMIIGRLDLRDKLASLIAKLTHRPAVATLQEDSVS